MVNRPALGPLRFNLRSLIGLVAWAAAMMGFFRFIMTSSVTAVRHTKMSFPRRCLAASPRGCPGGRVRDHPGGRGWG